MIPFAVQPGLNPVTLHSLVWSTKAQGPRPQLPPVTEPKNWKDIGILFSVERLYIAYSTYVRSITWSIDWAVFNSIWPNSITQTLLSLSRASACNWVGQLHAACAWQHIIFFLVYYFFTILLRLFLSFFFPFSFLTLSLHIQIYFNI